MPRRAPANSQSKARELPTLWRRRRRASERDEGKRTAARATVYVARDGRGRVTNAR
jgi:hypothetical protein